MGLELDPPPDDNHADSTQEGSAGQTRADRIWHSAAAGMPEPGVPSARSAPDSPGDAEHATPGSAVPGSVVPGSVKPASTEPARTEPGEPVWDDTVRIADSGPVPTFTPARPADAARTEDSGPTAALKPVRADGARPRRADGGADTATAAFRPARGGTARAADSGATAVLSPARGDNAQPDDARPDDGGAARTPRPAPGGAYAPLIGDVTGLRANWQHVQASFVDDPRGAVSDAADLVEHAAQVLAGALRQRQRHLRGLWDGPGGLTGDDRAPGDGAGPDGGRLRSILPRLRGSSKDSVTRGYGTGRARNGQRDGTSQQDGTGQFDSDGERDPDVGPEPTAGDGTADSTERLRIVIQQYRALFNQICRP